MAEPRTYRVAVFDHPPGSGRKMLTYTRDYSTSWAGCCIHDVDAPTSKLAREAAKDQHLRHCVLPALAVAPAGGGTP